MPPRTRYQSIPAVDTTGEQDGFISIDVKSSPTKSPRRRVSPRRQSPDEIEGILEKEKNVREEVKLSAQYHNDNREDDTQLKLIRIIGVPPPNSDGTITNPPYDHVQDPSEHVVDVLDAENEDPFSLDSLEEIALSHAKQGKDFIIARVTTVDLNDSSRFYYSYYDAFHINKVLFRTQPEQGLLHRMKAKNPLNNMTIEGDVHYYIIKASEIMRKLGRGSKTSSPIRKNSRTENIAGFISKTVQTVTRTSGNLTPTTRRHYRSKSGDFSITDFPSLLSNLNGSLQKTGAVSQTMAEPASKNTHRGRGERRRERKDQAEKEFSQRLGSISSSRRDSRRSSFDDAYCDPIPLVPPTVVNTVVMNSPVVEERTPFATAGSSRVQQAVSYGSMLLNRHRPVRSHAFANERTASMTLEDWVEMQRHEHQSRSRSRDRSSTSGSGKRSGLRHTSVSPVSSSPANREVYLDARYYGSDDDFLMKREVRLYFKENALEENDSVLFTLSGERSNVTSQQNPNANSSEFLYSSPTSEEDESGILAGLACLLKKKLVWLCITIYLVLSMTLIFTVVPPELRSYLIGSSLFLLFLSLVVTS